MIHNKKLGHNWNGEVYFNFQENGNRSWIDATKYGFISAGGGVKYIEQLRNLEIGDRVWIYVKHKDDELNINEKGGYGGVGIVTATAKPAKEVIINANGKDTSFFNLPLNAGYRKNDTKENAEWIVKVDFLHHVPIESRLMNKDWFYGRHIVCGPESDKWITGLKYLKQYWNIK